MPHASRVTTSVCAAEVVLQGHVEVVMSAGTATIGESNVIGDLTGDDSGQAEFN